MRNEDGDHFYAPTTLRSWFSVFQAFYLHSNRGKLKEVVPIIHTKLNQWMKEHEVKKAKTFTKSDLLPLFDAPNNTPDTLLWKAYSAIALACAARNCEMNKMTRPSSVVESRGEDGMVFFEVSFYRAKPHGPKVRMSVNIKGDLEVQALMEYRQQCFPPQKRVDKFFKRLVLKDGVIRKQYQYWQEFFEGLWQSYRKMDEQARLERLYRHCFRRTAATLAADHGLTLPQIKTLTGHASDSVA